MIFSFIHTADIHLDSPFTGLEKYDGAPAGEIRNATRQALKNLVKLSIDKDVEFIIIAGDLYDGNWHDFNTGLFFSSQMSRMREAGIQVFIASGNHDATSRITRSLQMPDNVHFFSADAPQTFKLVDQKVLLHGQGYARSAETSNLAAGYPEPLNGMFNIGILHTSLGGYSVHETYAPCSIEDLISKGYDYWALGHVHNREVVRKENPTIVFPGNIQGRHIREQGSKGCTVVTVTNDGEVRLEHHPLDVLRWITLSIDLSRTEDAAESIDIIRKHLAETVDDCEGRFLAVRINLTGSCNAHSEFLSNPDRWINEIRAAATDVSQQMAWVEKVTFDTAPPFNESELAESEGPIGDLLRYFQNIENDDEVLSQFGKELKDLRSKIPRAVQSGDDALDLESTESIRSLLEETRKTLLVRLLAEESTE